MRVPIAGGVRFAPPLRMRLFFLFLSCLFVGTGGYAEQHRPAGMPREVRARDEMPPSSVRLRRETAIPLQRCNRDSFAADLPVTNRYIQRLFNHITTANRSTFYGDLSPALFCVGVEKNLECPRAFADSQKRSFSIYTGLILLAQNDAQIATVMSHELAHITMRHTLCDGTIVQRDRRAVTERQCELEQLVKEQSELKERMFSNPPPPGAEDRMKQISRRIGATQEQIWDLMVAEVGAERAANWLEVEADEVGQELYRRAGFHEDEFTWRHEDLVLNPPILGQPALPSAQRSSTERRIAAHRACGFESGLAAREPQRGVARYASNCWTLWNLTINPARRHPRQTLAPQPDIFNLVGEPTLAEVKAEIRRIAGVDNTKGRCSVPAGRIE